MYLKIAICDDEKSFCDQLKKQLHDLMAAFPDFVPEIDCFTDTHSFLDSAAKTCYQLIFLDVEFPAQFSGIDLAKTLRQDDSYLYSEFVFITAHPEYALELYEVGAHHFIQKGQAQERQLKGILTNVLRRQPHGEEDMLLLKSTIIPLSGIEYFECQQHLILIHYHRQPAESLRISESFQSFCERLKDKKFVQISQSYCVNLRYIKSCQSEKLTLRNGAQLPVSRVYKARLKELLSEENI